MTKLQMFIEFFKIFKLDKYVWLTIIAFSSFVTILQYTGHSEYFAILSLVYGLCSSAKLRLSDSDMTIDKKINFVTALVLFLISVIVFTFKFNIFIEIASLKKIEDINNLTLVAIVLLVMNKTGTVLYEEIIENVLKEFVKNKFFSISKFRINFNKNTKD